MYKTFAAGLLLALSAVPLAAQNPNPTIVSSSVSPSTIIEGGSFTIQMTVRNDGGSSPEGGLTFSFPQLTGTGDASRVEGVLPPAGFSWVSRAKGQSITKSDGTQTTAQYLMVEAYGSWTTGATKTFQIQIRPAALGTFNVNFRSAMRNSSGVWFNEPPSASLTDQQGWPVQRKSGTVECAAPGSITLLQPANGQSFAPSTSSTTLSWNAATNAESYDVYFSTSSNPSLHSTVTSTSRIVTLQSDRTYFWRIVAKRSCTSQTSTSVTRSFTVQPPPTLVVTVRDLAGTPRQNAELVRYLASNHTPVGTNPTITGANGQATYTDVTANTAYDLEAYMKGPNPFDNLGELWATGRATVGTSGATPLTLDRAWPYSESHRLTRISDGQVLDSSSVIAPGTPIRLEITVRNRTDAPKDVFLRWLVDRDRIAPWDFDSTSSTKSVPAGGTQTFQYDFTPSQTGAYSFAVKTQVTAPWGKTDAWDWVSLLSVDNGTVVARVRNANSAPWPGAKVYRYVPGSSTPTGSPVTTDGSGQAQFSNLTPGTSWDFKAFFEGVNPFDTVGELWSIRSRTVTPGTQILELPREQPYVETFQIFRVSDGQELSGTSIIPPGAQVRLEIYVRNRLASPQSVTVQTVLDGDGAAGWELNQLLAGTAAINDLTKLATLFTPTQVGTYRKAVYTRTAGIKTDAWDWGPAFVVQATPADLTVSDVSGHRPTVAPGGTLRVGFTVHNNGGTATSAVTNEVRLSTNNNATILDGTLLGTLAVPGIAPGGFAVLVPSGLTVPAGTQEGRYWIKVKADPANAIPEGSNEGNNIAVSLAQMVVSRFGTTVITHGFQLGGSLNCWPFQMARAILTRSGGGKILQYDKTSNTFQACQSPDPCGNTNHCASPDPAGETILLFDWAQESNNNFQGFSEAAGDALFSALIRGEQGAQFTLDPIHFIGHSRGTVVNSEAVERLLAFAKPVDHVTMIDPVDEGWAAQLDDYDVNAHGDRGAVAWLGTGFTDSYYSLDFDSCFGLDLDGRRIEGANNLNLSNLGSVSNIDHLDIHAWYHFTIDTTAEDDGDSGICTADDLGTSWFDQTSNSPLCETTASERRRPSSREYDGYFFSRLGGGKGARCSSTFGPKTTVLFNPEEEGIVNGDFERGPLTFQDQATRGVPGWSWNGGGGTGHVDLSGSNRFLELDRDNVQRVHNWFYMPADSRAIRFCMEVSVPDFGLPPYDYLEVKLGERIEPRPLAQPTGYCYQHEVVVPDELKGKVTQLGFTLRQGGALLNTEVRIDNVEIVLAKAAPAPILQVPVDEAILSTLTPSFQWSAFQPGASGAARSGYQLRVRSDEEGDRIVYDTGYVTSTTATTHVYAPGAYTGTDSLGQPRMSEPLVWGRHYHWHVRYRDANGVWSPWSADSIDAHQDFRTFQPGSPAIAVSQPSLSATTLAGSSPAAQTFEIWNGGVGTLSYSISDNQTWLSAGPSPGTSTGEHDTITVTFSSATLAPGAYSATITISAAGASNTPVQIPVGLIVEGPPTLSVTPPSLDFGNVQIGTVAELAFTVRNSGGGRLIGTASVNGAFSIANGDSYDLGAGQSQSVVIRFAPTALQTYLGSASFTGGGGATRPVSGNGVEITYTLSIARAGTGTGRVTSAPAGILCGEDCAQSYGQGTSVVLTATSTNGSTFGGWSGDPDCQDGIVSMTSDLTCTATFTAAVGGSGGGGIYRFEEGSGATATDSSGAGNHGTISGVTYVTGRSGAGSALRFGSDLGAVSLPSSLYTGFGNTAYIEAWVRPTAYPSSPCVATVFRKRAHLNDWSLEIDSQGRIRTYIYNASHTDAASATGSGVPLNTWSKVASWYDGAVLRVYLNDNLVGLQAKAFPLDWTGSYHGTEIGNVTHDGGSCYKFIGDIDDVVIAKTSPGAGLDFYTLAPCRVIDTRSGSPLVSGQAYSVRVAGVCSVPASAKAVALNITAISATGSGNLTLWPADIARPVASTINFQPGTTRSNNAVLSLAGDGLGDLAVQPAMAGNGTVHVVIDVTGYFQ